MRIRDKEIRSCSSAAFEDTEKDHSYCREAVEVRKCQGIFSLLLPGRKQPC
jgi:hypothetical protein